ncbi:DUF6020 family protein [uncultured Bifidobacterium sp.]|uniref:DUF6020 family protein n=1 Tax=uncultured Bifidobacterium sp. TaxID=165187 RepID=UPI0028DC1634|nr:DUF6020 family protein [uncultured Bifidobacterium sp.]
MSPVPPVNAAAPWETTYLHEGGHGPRPTRPFRRTTVGGALRWGFAVLVCLWMALCTAVAPLYWRDSSIRDFSGEQASILLFSFLVYLGIVLLLVRYGHGHGFRRRRTTKVPLPEATAAPEVRGRRRPRRRAARTSHMRLRLRRGIIRATGSFRGIAIILLVGWAWAPITLVSAFGADVFSQIREFSWAWNQWTGLDQPYIGFFSFVPMDIYPTAHYLWPSDATYLTDQHNVVLTVVTGAAATASRFLTGSNDWGLAAVSLLQTLIAALCCAATANRFFNTPWLPTVTAWTCENADPRRPETGRRPPQACLLRPDRGVVLRTLPAVRDWGSSTDGRGTSCFAGTATRVTILVFLLVCPLVVLSTISLTKSPLFAFAFVWWFGVCYEMHCTSQGTAAEEGRTTARRWTRDRRRGIFRLRGRSVAALALSTVLMLVSAKYAWYIIVVTAILMLLADRRHRRETVIALLLPTLVVHGGISLLIRSGAVISGDPIESRGVQIQQIARIASRNPEAIQGRARTEISRIFNLDQMADAYKPQDADPVKSSGIQSKKVSYRWRTVTAADMASFNDAWAHIVAADPVTAVDAFLAKCYGYFAVTDAPYVSMSYYVNNGYVAEDTAWIGRWNPQWRAVVAGVSEAWSSLPVLGWPVNGNLYVSLTLLLAAAEVVLRRWRSLAWHLPLLMLMGVMVLSPANNFDRHMLPLVFVFGFLALQFIRESHEIPRKDG